jgi:hypothetical protein
MLPNKKDNTYNVYKTFDYFTIKAMVTQSLENIVRQELNRHIRGINLQKIDIDVQEDEDTIIANTASSLFDDQHDTKLSAPLLKLRIRNTTEYLNWRIAILRRDKFKCRMYTASIKDNKGLRLEVHHAKSFNDICNENNIATIKQALACKEIWSSDNGIYLCYSCHKNLEKLKSKIRNIFV